MGKANLNRRIGSPWNATLPTAAGNLPSVGWRASLGQVLDSGGTLRAALCLTAALALAGCRRAPGPPDANYQQASQLYQQLYASQLDDAYGDPQMDQVESLLKKVDR